MGFPSNLDPLGYFAGIKGGYLIYQNFGAGTVHIEIEPGYLWTLNAGSGGKRKSNIYGSNSSGGSGAVMDCIVRIPRKMKVEVVGYAYDATGKYTYIRDITGLTAEEIAAQTEEEKKYILQVGCGTEAVNEWKGGEGGKFGVINQELIKYIRDQREGIGGNNTTGGTGYPDSPWGKIGCANWNYATDKSLIRLDKQGLASDGYVELWYIGNLQQAKLKYVPEISINTWDQTQMINKKEVIS